MMSLYTHQQNDAGHWAGQKQDPGPIPPILLVALSLLLAMGMNLFNPTPLSAQGVFLPPAPVTLVPPPVTLVPPPPTPLPPVTRVPIAVDRWAGTIVDESGNPLNAVVRINGEAVRASDNGRFEVYVQRARDSRYVVNVEQFGYLPYSEVHVGVAIETLNIQLKEAQRIDLVDEDGDGNVSVEDRKGTRIDININDLVDANGNPARVPLQLLIYSYDIREEAMVGDMGGLNAAGELVAMETYGAFYAEFSDAEGNVYNLADGATAQVSVPLVDDILQGIELQNPGVQGAELRQHLSMPLWSYDAERGLWIEEGQAALQNDRLVGEVPHFSIWNFDVEKQEPACIRLTVDPVYLALNSPIQVKAVLLSPTRVRNLSLTQTTNALYNLPANTNVEFYLPPTAPTPFATVNTGAPWGGTGTPPHPYDVCNGELHLDGAPATGTIQGMKFHDLNGDGVQDPDEPGLAGWTIVAIHTDGTVHTTTTNANGHYEFADMEPGDYRVREEWQAGAVQTYPVGVFHNVSVAADETVEDINFGNNKPCENPESDGCSAGVGDNFDVSNGVESSTPSADLLAHAVSNGWPTVTQFDATLINRFFLHTFGASDLDTCLSGDCVITDATFATRLKAGPSGLVSNDTIGFLQDGVVIWSARISSLPGVGGSWNPGDVVDITLDLANLPPNGLGVTNILAALQDGELDVFVQDDTFVDYMTTKVAKCCDEDCINSLDVFNAGIADEFTAPTEATDPSAGLQLRLNGRPLRDFDDLGSNQFFAHTFTDFLPEIDTSDICSVTLEIRAKPGRELMYNDTLSLSFTDEQGQPLATPWGRYFGEDNLKTGLFPYRWGTDNGKAAETIVLDLSALPVAPEDGGGTVSVLGLMNLLGYLDVTSQDDTGVDMMKLSVYTCCDEVSGPDLTIEKQHRGTFHYGENGVYALAISNMGDAAATGPITVTDRLPAGMTFVSSGTAPWSCSASGQTVTCTHPGPLPAMTSAPLLSIEGAVAPVSQFPGPSNRITNCAYVEMTGDVNRANDAACDTTVIEASPHTGGVHGIKFHDVNGNGVQDGNESGLAGWTILIEDSSGVVLSVTTDANGNYSFTGLASGVYTLTEVLQPGWTQTYPATGSQTITLGDGEVAQGINFGNWRKSDEWCNVGWDINVFNQDPNNIEVGMRIYNQSGTDASYQMDVVGLPGFSIQGFHVTTPFDGNQPSPTPPVFVQNGRDVYLAVFMHFPTFTGPSGQYQVIVTNEDTGYTFGCSGQLWKNDFLGVQPVDNELAQEIAPNVPQEIKFELHNLADREIVAQVWMEDMFGLPGEEVKAIRLNGLAPGERVEQEVRIPAGEVAEVGVLVELIEAIPNAGGDILFFADIDGDEAPDVVSAVLLNVAEDECPLVIGDVNCDELVNILDLQILIRMMLSPTQPDTDLYPSAMWLRSDINGDGVWNIFDLQQLINLIVN
ncbi:MAG: SdrD B-like domain-containing protein [Chloroflexota bacterium]